MIMQKNLRKILLTLMIVVIYPVYSLFSEDLIWGGSFENNTEFLSAEDQLVNQFNNFDFWLEYEISPLYSFKADAGYSFYYEDDEVIHLPEVSNLTLYGKQEGSSFKIGRLHVSDFNSNIYESSLDGLEFTIYGDNLEIITGAGYTGFIFNRNSNILLSASDEESFKNGDLFGSPRFIQTAELDIFYGNDETFTFSMLTQGDMRDDQTLTEGYGKLDTLYVMFGFSGHGSDSFGYNIFAIGEVGGYDIPTLSEEGRSLKIYAAAGGVEIDFTPDIPLSPLFSVDMFYSTGDGWSRTDWQGSFIDPSKSTLHQYNPFSAEDIGYVYNTRAGNIFYGNAAISISPFSFLTMTINSLTLFRSVNGPVYEIPLDETATSHYLGEELSLALDFELQSDLNFIMKGGLFVPNESLVTEEMQYKLSANLTYSFGSDSEMK